MDNPHNDVNDLVGDPYFRRWVKQPDEETNAFWKEWLAERPGKADAFAQAKRIVSFLNFRVEEARSEEQQEVKRHVMQRIRTKHHTPARTYFPQRYLAVAAVVCFLLIGGYLVQRFALSTPYQEYTTTFGEQQEIILPDDTRVTLNANSLLKFEKAWSESPTREVWLEGEAFFEVVKQPGAVDGRFIVHTLRLDVEALGTSFNVQARDEETHVVLNTGKVKLHPAHSASGKSDLFLKPGDMATLRQDRLVKTQVNPQHYSSWQDNRLFFDNVSIREIARRLKNTYGYEVTVEKPEWLDLTFTGSCPADDISILLTALSESFHLKVTRKNKKITLQQPNKP